MGSCGISVALTSEACLKGLPKTTAGEVVAFKGWPKLQWFVTEHLAKTPKDWLPPPKLTDDTPAYIEVGRIEPPEELFRRNLEIDLNFFLLFFSLPVHDRQGWFGNGSDRYPSGNAITLQNVDHGL